MLQAMDGDFELREFEWTPARFAVALLLLVTAGTNFALTTTTGQLRFAVLAIGLLVGFVVYVTDLWRSIYHLVGACYVLGTAAVWFVSGQPHLLVGLLEKGLELVLVVTFLYLLFDDRRDVQSAE